MKAFDMLLIYRQGIKVSSNLFISFRPFLIFLLGGYLTIKGQIELGAYEELMAKKGLLYDPVGAKK